MRHHTANVGVGSNLAQIGSLLVNMAAKGMTTDFCKRIGEQLAGCYGVVLVAEVAAPEAAGGGGTVPRIVA